MESVWIVELRSFAARALVCVIVGAVLGAVELGVAAGVLWYALRHLLHAKQLAEWLAKGRVGYPPEGDGVWDSIFSQFHAYHRSDRRTKRELRVLLGRFRHSTAAIPDGLLVTDSVGNIEWANKSATTLLGVSDKRDRGQRVENLIRNPLFIQYWQNVSGDDFVVLPAPVGNERTLEMRSVRFGDGHRLLIARDSTERQRVERMRRDFVANVSHELRTPLTVLSGYLENMDRDREHLPPRWHRPVSSMRDQVGRMHGLVEDLLLLARVETDTETSDLEPVGAPELVQQVHSDSVVLNSESQHAIEREVDELVDIRGVPSELLAVFSNLASNAVQHSPPGTRIALRWARCADGVQFEVVDSGEGIAPEHLARLTERFYRVDSGRSRAQGGTGLGLSIVKHILEKHGARLEIESELGKGSTFRCVFPSDIVIEREPHLRVVSG